jgi:hypothetical protein
MPEATLERIRETMREVFVDDRYKFNSIGTPK